MSFERILAVMTKWLPSVGLVMALIVALSVPHGAMGTIGANAATTMPMPQMHQMADKSGPMDHSAMPEHGLDHTLCALACVGTDRAQVGDRLAHMSDGFIIASWMMHSDPWQSGVDPDPAQRPPNRSFLG